MALINDTMEKAPKEPMAPVQGHAQGAPAAKGGGDPKSIQRRLGTVAMSLIYNKDVSAKLVEQLKSGAQNPAQTVAMAALGIMNRMKRDVQGIEPNLVFSISAIVVVFILELAAVSKAFPVDQAMLAESMKALSGMMKQEQSQPEQGQPPGGMQPQGAMPPPGMPQAEMQPPGMVQ